VKKPEGMPEAGSDKTSICGKKARKGMNMKKIQAKKIKLNNNIAAGKKKIQKG
jgi:hypothetical protein